MGLTSPYTVGMLPERIDRRIDRTGACWIWTGPLQKNGYGAARWKVDGEWGHSRVHRLMYEDSYGPVPPGLEIDHTCKVRACCKPSHLRAITHAENCQDRSSNGPPRADVCGRGHAYADPGVTYLYPNGRRGCRPCLTLLMRERRHRLR